MAMSDQRRFRREPLERAAPVRSFVDFWTGRRRSGGRAQSRPGEGAGCDPVSQTVRLAYDVANEQIKLGRRVAQQINSRSYSVDGASDDLQEMTRRIWRFSEDLVALWVDAAAWVPGGRPFERAASGPNGRGTKVRADATAWRRGPEATGAPPAGEAEVVAEVTSRRPTRVSVDLWQRCADQPLVTHGARALDKTVPPIDQISFTPATADSVGVLAVVVTDDQPPGDYTAVLLAPEQGGEIVGVVKIKVAG